MTNVEGDTKKCFSCQQVMTYRYTKSDGKYPAKLQWQNPDGTSHFGFDQDKGKPFCKSNAPKVERAARAGEATQASGQIHLKDLKLGQEEILKIQEETDKMLERQLCRIYWIEEGLKGRGINPSGPFVGMLYNQQMESLRNL